jgi:signal peptidase II
MTKNKKYFSMTKIILFTMIFVFLLTIDQWSKYMAANYLKTRQNVILIPHVFSLEYLENHGAAFGIFQGKQLFLLILTAVIVLLLEFFSGYLYHTQNKRFTPLIISINILMSGAIGNMIDRIKNNYVIDFLRVNFFNFPIFNFADCFVVISAFSFLILILFYYQESDFPTFSKSHKSSD